MISLKLNKNLIDDFNDNGFLILDKFLDLIIKNLKDNQNYSEVFKSSTKQALEDFKGKKIKIGRARMFEDKTKDLDDPGMFALNRLSSIF